MYGVVTGVMESGGYKMAEASKRLSSSIVMKSRMTHSLHLLSLSGLAYSEDVEEDQVDGARLDMEKEAVAAVTWQKLLVSHRLMIK